MKSNWIITIIIVLFLSIGLIATYQDELRDQDFSLDALFSLNGNDLPDIATDVPIEDNRDSTVAGPMYGPDKAPSILNYETHTYTEKPDSNATFKPSLRYSIEYSITNLYPNHGVTSLKLNNEGDNPIFVYSAGLTGDWMEEGYWYSKELGFKLQPGKSKDLGLISFDSAENTGYHDLRIGISVLAQNGEGEWYDYGTKYLEEEEYEIKPLAEGNYNEMEKEDYYKDKIQNLVNPENPEVKSLAENITENYKEEYNVYQISALFDWVKNNISYESDPKGEQDWSTPQETLELEGGDCEDQAMLLASMIESLGGKTRIILTDNHAYSSVYIGPPDYADNVLEGIREYYGTGLSFAYRTVENQAWLVLESSGGLYPGDYPVGSKPTDDGWTFTNTEKLTYVDSN